MLRFLVFLVLISCQKTPTQSPVKNNQPKGVEDSAQWAKSRNAQEQAQIKAWILAQGKTYFPSPSGYWSSEAIFGRKPREDGEIIHYNYGISDLGGNVLYTREQIGHRNMTLGKTKEFSALVDALRYLNAGESVRLLVPSFQGFGVGGDADRVGAFEILIVDVVCH